MISVESSGSGSGSGPPVETENLGPPKVPKVAAIAAIGFSYVFLNIPSTLCFFVATTFRTFQLMKLIVTSGKREGGRYFTNLTPQRLFCLRHVFIMFPLHFFQLTSVTILPFLDAYRIIYKYCMLLAYGSVTRKDPPRQDMKKYAKPTSTFFYRGYNIGIFYYTLYDYVYIYTYTHILH